MIKSFKEKKLKPFLAISAKIIVINATVSILLEINNLEYRLENLKKPMTPNTINIQEIINNRLEIIFAFLLPI